ncbi:unnamed protein product [Mycena citricolor]|uniref:Major facilitator superfamily (MFS) profile domain-containing protein n=1 Tax=Mycena citricolor TaxID=2018698 RepID=A0AAD2HPK0_9AGAR|nr:unnamed protein product [Mycena citricolor]
MSSPSAVGPSFDCGILPIPRRLRYDPARPFVFTMVLNVLFGFAATFIVANLYYCQPLLILRVVWGGLRSRFSDTDAAAGRASHRHHPRVLRLKDLSRYATGILFISPLGDLVRRRQLILTLTLVSASLTVGVAVTKNIVVFEALSFLIGMVSLTPQIMIPLAADLAPPERRGSALSIVYSGLLLGVLVARVIAGIIGQFTSWRVVYYLAIGVQVFVLLAGYLIIPDYPAKNTDLTYFKILSSMARFAVTEPILVQACLVNLASCACFTNFWVTLTFLLGGAPYFYSTLTIGLFGLIGILSVVCGPLFGKLIDGLMPWYASMCSILFLLSFQAIQTAAETMSVAVVVIAIIGLDMFRQSLQMSLAAAVFEISTAARARLNALFVLSLFIGQLMGTAAGTKVYTAYGWRAAAALNMGFYGWILIVLLVRGPHCGRFTWFGYEGGWAVKKVKAAQTMDDTPSKSSSVRGDQEAAPSEK